MKKSRRFIKNFTDKKSNDLIFLNKKIKMISMMKIFKPSNKGARYGANVRFRNPVIADPGACINRAHFTKINVKL